MQNTTLLTGKKVLILLSTFLFSVTISPAQCVGYGPNTANVAVNDNSVGTLDFSNSANALASDNSFATTNVSLGTTTTTTTHFLKTTNFGFAFPNTAEICGIEVMIERGAGSLVGAGEYVRDSKVSLVKKGTIESTNYATSTDWGSENMVTYGGPTDLWGTTWDYNDVNDVDFGVAISALYNSVASAAPVASIDDIQVRIYYTINSILGGGINRFQATLQNNNTSLTWTSSPEGIDSFLVQRSTDKTVWETREAMGNLQGTNDINQYASEDQLPIPGKYYYRIGMVRPTKTTYSETIMVDYVGDKTLSFYPNPATEYVILSNLKENSTIELMSMYGTVIKKLVYKNGNGSIKIDLKDQPGGFYILNINGKGHKFLKK